MPDLYNLFWYEPPIDGTGHPVPLQQQSVVGLPFFVPALILYPALLTPAVHVRAKGDDDMFELLLMGPDDPVITPAVVAAHLHIGVGLDPQRRIPLFLPSGSGKILVDPAPPDGNGIIKTHGRFKGILDPRFLKRAKKAKFTKFYSVRIEGGYLPPRDVTLAEGPNAERQDKLIREMLKDLNGPALQGQGGRGTHCFKVSSNGVDVTQVDSTQPIQAYHPLYVYQPDELGYARIGHVSDIHLNARQDVLRHSPARVIEAPQAEADSPKIGSLMNVCSRSFSSILNSMGSGRADMVLVGGDLIDHIHNAYPFQANAQLPSTEFFPIKQVWDLVDLDNNYATHYQAFVDYISFFSVIRNFVANNQIPVFGITGNHDCYKDAYGISPRVGPTWTRANEGIPTDNNLTFYEAILMFGESWHEVVTKLNFKPDLFEWFYGVLTPFTDFVVDLPKQRVAGLAWGEKEEVISMPGSYGQGFGHLPRAEEAVTPGQLALFKDGFAAAKKTVLLTHFTFVSYDDGIPISTPPAPNAIDFAGTGVWRKGDPFTHFDMGTFEKNRRDLYDLVRDVPKMQCIFTGHSHRKGLYFLAPPSGDKAMSEMCSFIDPLTDETKQKLSARTPIIVSDSAGPLPRLNLKGEFSTVKNVAAADKKAWGSDRPAGTLVDFDGNGLVTNIRAAQAGSSGSKPRLAVALDYHHIVNEGVFLTFETTPFRPKDFMTNPPALKVVLHSSLLDLGVKIDGLTLHCKSARSADWKSMTTTWDERSQSWLADPSLFHEWCTMAPKAGRFVSFRMSFTNNTPVARHYDTGTAWNFEVDAVPKYLEFFGSQMKYLFTLPPEFDPHGNNEQYSRQALEAPSFDWRKQLPQYK